MHTVRCNFCGENMASECKSRQRDKNFLPYSLSLIFRGIEIKWVYSTLKFGSGAF